MDEVETNREVEIFWAPNPTKLFLMACVLITVLNAIKKSDK